MSSFEKKEQNLNQLIDKLNSMSLSYSQPNNEVEKIKTEKNELVYQKKEIEKYLMSLSNFGKKNTSWIFNLGHGFIPGIDVKNVNFVVEWVKNYNWNR